MIWSVVSRVVALPRIAAMTAKPRRAAGVGLLRFVPAARIRTLLLIRT
jgi:hypothetical protein